MEYDSIIMNDSYDDLYDNVYSEEEIDMLIMKERNANLYELNQDVEHISDIMITLNSLLQNQGEELDNNYESVNRTNEDVEISTKNLKDTETIHMKNIKMIRDVAIVVGGIVLGGLGFIAGPIVGVATLTTSLCASGGIVYTAHKIKK